MPKHVIPGNEETCSDGLWVYQIADTGGGIPEYRDRTLDVCFFTLDRLDVLLILIVLSALQGYEGCKHSTCRACTLFETIAFTLYR